MELTLVGKRAPRIDGVGKATGQARYGADMALPHMLHGKILRSPHPHARVLNINASKAERLPGVKAVITARDFPDVRLGFSIKDQPVLARDRVRYIGEPVAAVAATGVEAAEEALGLIQVEYEELPPIFDPLAAMEPQATLIHPDLEGYVATFEAIRQGNVCSHTKIRRGDVQRGFQEADLVFEGTFQTQKVHQGYIEPHAVVAALDASGRVTVWSTSQAPFLVRLDLSEALQIPLSHIRVIASTLGGAFGGKLTLLEPVCVALAARAGRPVKVEMSRLEEFLATNPRHPCQIELRTAVKRDGTLVALQARSVYDTGAYAGMGPLATGRCAFVQGPYNIPNVQIDGYCVYTNKSSCGSCRAPGAPPSAFAIETQMDEIARELGMDAAELRLRNALQDGDLSPTGQVLHNVGLRQTIQEVVDRVGWDKPFSQGQTAPQKRRGRGMACCQWASGAFASSASLKLNEDGSVVLSTGAVDVGSGNGTVLAQIAGEGLGIPLEDIVVVSADTDTTPYDAFTGSSRVTHNMGDAVKMAAANLRQQVLALAAEQLEAKLEDLEIANRQVWVRGSPERSIPIAALSMVSHFVQGGPLLATGSSLHEHPHFDPKVTVEGHPHPAMPTPTYGTQYAEVEVDAETGDLRVLRYVAAHDVGCAINPQGVEGQIEGGVVQGMGYALSEEILSEKGRVLNPILGDYRLPTSLDCPNVEPLILEVKADQGPYGAKGVGEPPTIAVAPAIANAVYDAIGVRIRELPISPERIRTALREKGDSRPKAREAEPGRQEIAKKIV